MNLNHVPLLQVQRDLHAMPRSRERFESYLRIIGARDGAEQLEYPPLLIMNPMGKEHVTALLDELLAIDADAIAARTTAEAAAQLSEEPGDFRIALVIGDDLKGGWTNRYASEFTLRFPDGPSKPRPLPRWAKHHWITAVVWSSESVSEQAVREAVLAAVYRTAYWQRHGLAATLRDMMTQEGQVLARAGCKSPALDSDDIAYTREVLVPYFDAADKRTCMECLFGDEAGQTLGFTRRGLSPWAGIALALHDARRAASTANESSDV